MSKTPTYNKQLAHEAAERALKVFEAERADELRRWDATSAGYRFLEGFFGSGRPERHRWYEIETAKRVSFKGLYATENSIPLTDAEIDVIRLYWDLRQWS